MAAWTITQKRPLGPRAGLALAVLLAHAAIFQVVFNPFTHVGRLKIDDPAMTWVRVEPTVMPPSAVPDDIMGRPAPFLSPAPWIAPVTPDIPSLTPSRDPIAAALDPYVSCALPDDNRLWTEDQKRCAQRLWDIYKDAPPREQTEAEKELARKFEHDLKVQNAPLLLPCFSPAGGIGVSCLLRGLSQGFEPNAGYVEMDTRRTHVQGMPRPPKLPGMKPQ